MLYQSVFEANANVLMRIVVPKFVREVGVRVGLLVLYLLYGYWYVINLDGLVVGRISGNVNGIFRGTIDGETDLRLLSGKISREDEKEQTPAEQTEPEKKEAPAAELPHGEEEDSSRHTGKRRAGRIRGRKNNGGNRE